MLPQLAYDVLTTLAAAPGAAYLAVRPEYRPLLRRFAPPVPARLDGAPIWVQACSMGEVNAARPILEAMAARWPDIPILLTTSTLAGRRQAEKTAGTIPVTWFPFDHRVCVGRFLERLGPRLLVLLETEVWPNAVWGARRRSVPVAVLNGRISDKHFRRYRRMKRFWRPVFGALSAVGAQNGSTRTACGSSERMRPRCMSPATPNSRACGRSSHGPKSRFFAGRWAFLPTPR